MAETDPKIAKQTAKAPVASANCKVLPAGTATPPPSLGSRAGCGPAVGTEVVLMAPSAIGGIAAVNVLPARRVQVAGCGRCPLLPLARLASARGPPRPCEGFPPGKGRSPG